MSELMITPIITNTGGLLNPESIGSYNFDIKFIAKALSYLCRYNGHTPYFYSVAQHCIHVAKFLPYNLRLLGLLHDAAECFVGDLITPIKNSCPNFELFEMKVLNTIFHKYELPFPLPQEVVDADKYVTSAEINHFFYNKKTDINFKHRDMLDVSLEFIAIFEDCRRGSNA